MTATVTETPNGAHSPDINQDGQVDAGDALLLLLNLGEGDSGYDLNGDSRVDRQDLFFYSHYWKNSPDR
jgi:hypothetical protein